MNVLTASRPCNLSTLKMSYIACSRGTPARPSPAQVHKSPATEEIHGLRICDKLDMNPDTLLSLLFICG